MRDLFVEGLTIFQYLEASPEGEERLECDWLFFPELKTFGSNPKSIRRAQEKLLLELIEHVPAIDLPHRLVPDTEIEQREITVRLHPPSDLPLWGSDLELIFPCLVWEQSKLRIAFVPALGIEIPIQPGDKVEEVVDDQVRFALNRRRINHRLFDLSLLQRCTRMEVNRFRWNVYPLSPKERFKREEGAEESVEPVLKEIGRRLDDAKPDPVFEREEDLARIASQLKGKRGASSILLVGESGVGKTAVVQYLAANQSKFELSVRKIFHTPGSRIVAGMCGFGDWQERCRKMALEASAKPGTILFFGNLLEILEVGQSAASTESIGSFFRPWLVRRQFIAIAECTPDQLSRIEQKDPRILEAFRQIKINPPPEDVTRKILAQVVKQTKHEVALSAAAQKRIFALHRRYAGYSAMPGKMLHFTKRLVSQNRPAKGKDSATRVTPQAINKLFALETGLPAFLLDDSIALDLEKTTEWFAKRIKGQPEAIRHVVDHIAAIKSRLSRPRRPLASFLFVGPTGVGKTELAKTIAEYFYGSRDRLLRIDMSEYSFPGSASRLASGGPGEPEGILTSRMRDQPFSVVLLDEFEKADAAVFDLFLQVLGEARLTDGAGRLADFSNAVIVLTSNLGAAGFRASAAGFGDPERSIETRATDHFIEAAKRKFRPEFFNRIGHIVPFLPLDHDSVRAVISREISQLDDRDGFKTREIALLVDDPVIDALASVGFDPRYGARPLKRTIEAKLLKPVGEHLITHPQLRSGTIEVSSLDPQTGKIEFSFFEDEKGRSREERNQIQFWKEALPGLRRWHQMLENSHLVSELHSEARRLERKINFKANPSDHENLAQSQRLLQRIGESSSKVFELEEKLLLSEFEGAPFGRFLGAYREAPTWNDFCAILRDTYLWAQKSSPQAVLIFTSDNASLLSRFASVYREAVRGLGCRIRAGYYRIRPEEEDLDPEREGYRKPYLPEKSTEIEKFFNGSIPGNCAALVMECRKAQIGLPLSLEFGVHQFINSAAEKFHVRITGFVDEDFSIQQGYVADSTLLNRNFRDEKLRRIWNGEKGWMKDEYWGSSEDSIKVDTRYLPSEFSPPAVVKLVEMTLTEYALNTIR